MTGPLPSGTVLLSPADAALTGWAIRHTIMSLRASGRSVPSALALLFAQLTDPTVAGSGSAPAGTLTIVPPSSPAEEMTVREASVIIGVSERQVRQLAAAGELEARRIGSRAWLLDRSAVQAYSLRRGQQVT